MLQNGLEIVYMPIGDIVPYMKNPRKNDETIRRLADDFKNPEIGVRLPIVVDKNKVIIVGHSRFFAAKAVGLESYPVIIDEAHSDAENKAFRIRDNTLPEFSMWDDDLLAGELLEGINELSLDITDFGLTAFELEGILHRAGIDLDSEVASLIDNQKLINPGTHDSVPVFGEGKLGGEQGILFTFGEYSVKVPIAVYDLFKKLLEKQRDSGVLLMEDILTEAFSLGDSNG